MRQARGLPLLRSPPFPGVPRAIAAISEPLEAPVGIGSADVDPALLSRLRTARVGGSFWAPATMDRRPFVLRPRTVADIAPMLETANAAGARPRDMLAVCDSRPDRTLADALVREGITIETGPIDPWSLLDPGTTLLARPDDEWCLIAHLAGAETTHHPDNAMLASALHAVAYRDCFTGSPATIDEAITILGGWRTSLDRVRPVTVAMGMAWWKRDAIRRLLWAGRRTPLRLIDEPSRAVWTARAAGGVIAAWPSRVSPDLDDRAAGAGVPVARVEDGFIRSVGLGSNLHPPHSIVLDSRGIYYDPSCPSDLEDILEHAVFPPDLLARGEALARFIVERGISKYARGGEGQPVLARDGRRLVLVTGQVEDDLSVKRAGGDVAGNLDLLRRARAVEPKARLLFKPHPDVDAGHRVGRIDDAIALQLADAVVRDPIDALLEEIDAIHVLTSLTGFEALLREREVIVHGHPFYAGWGLTTDLAGPIARRTRRLSLAELVAGTLILYPLYLDPVTRLPCPPEIVLERFASGTVPKPGLLIRARAIQGRIAKRLGKATS